MGKLFVLEGGDGAGKTVQTGLLHRYLTRTKGKPVEIFDFPQYRDTVFGATIQRGLQGELGDFLGLSPYLASTLYMLDRVVALPAILRALERGHVVCNRYVTSNAAFQAAKLEPDQQGAFLQWLETCEYDTLGLPRPSCVFYLVVPVETGRAMSFHRSGGLDAHESNFGYQRKVRDVYDRFAAEGTVVPIQGANPDGSMRDREEIHADIRLEVDRVLSG